jgi:hypothetical protein
MSNFDDELLTVFDYDTHDQFHLESAGYTEPDQENLPNFSAEHIKLGLLALSNVLLTDVLVGATYEYQQPYCNYSY